MPGNGTTCGYCLSLFLICVFSLQGIIASKRGNLDTLYRVGTIDQLFFSQKHKKFFIIFICFLLFLLMWAFIITLFSSLVHSCHEIRPGGIFQCPKKASSVQPLSLRSNRGFFFPAGETIQGLSWELCVVHSSTYGTIKSQGRALCLRIMGCLELMYLHHLCSGQAIMWHLILYPGNCHPLARLLTAFCLHIWPDSGVLIWDSNAASS